MFPERTEKFVLRWFVTSSLNNIVGVPKKNHEANKSKSVSI